MTLGDLRLFVESHKNLPDNVPVTVTLPDLREAGPGFGNYTANCIAEDIWFLEYDDEDKDRDGVGEIEIYLNETKAVDILGLAEE